MPLHPPTPPPASIHALLLLLVLLPEQPSRAWSLLGPIFPGDCHHSCGSQGAPVGTQETDLFVGQLRCHIPALMYSIQYLGSPLEIWPTCVVELVCTPPASALTGLQANGPYGGSPSSRVWAESHWLHHWSVCCVDWGLSPEVIALHSFLRTGHTRLIRRCKAVLYPCGDKVGLGDRAASEQWLMGRLPTRGSQSPGSSCWWDDFVGKRGCRGRSLEHQ